MHMVTRIMVQCSMITAKYLPITAAMGWIVRWILKMSDMFMGPMFLAIFIGQSKEIN